MSKVKFYRDLEANVPTGIAHVGKVYFTNERNLFIIDSAGNKQKFTDVVFMANQAAITALATKLREKLYIAIAEGTIWHWNGTALAQLGGGAGGGGDMLKSIYDVTNQGFVDNSKLLAGQPHTYYLSRANHTGTQSADSLVDGTTNKAFTASEKTKLAGVATGATANDTDANLKNRANHTGTQDAATVTGTKTSNFISDFAATVRATVITGLSTATHAVISATDTVLQALGKLQRQITEVKSTADTALQPSVILDEDDMASDSDTHVPTQQSVKAYVDATVTAIGAGDMDKATYDANNNGVVDNAEALQGQNGAHYLNRTNHTGSQDAASITGTKTSSFISDFATSVRVTVLTGLSTATNAAIAAADSVLVALGKLQAQIDGLPNATQTLTNKTLTSPIINTPTGLVKSDVGLGNVDNTSDATKNSATATLTNKRITMRVQSVASAATVTPNADADDCVTITAQAAALTLANPTGTPTSMQPITIRIKDNGTARTIGYGSQYRAIGITLPTTTVINKTIYLGMVWNAADTTWDVIGYALQA